MMKSVFRSLTGKATLASLLLAPTLLSTPAQAGSHADIALGDISRNIMDVAYSANPPSVIYGGWDNAGCTGRFPSIRWELDVFESKIVPIAVSYEVRCKDGVKRGGISQDHQARVIGIKGTSTFGELVSEVQQGIDAVIGTAVRAPKTTFAQVGIQTLDHFADRFESLARWVGAEIAMAHRNDGTGRKVNLQYTDVPWPDSETNFAEYVHGKFFDNRLNGGIANRGNPFGANNAWVRVRGMPQGPTVITGHSLGGAISHIIGYYLRDQTRPWRLDSLSAQWSPQTTNGRVRAFGIAHLNILSFNGARPFRFSPAATNYRGADDHWNSFDTFRMTILGDPVSISPPSFARLNMNRNHVITKRPNRLSPHDRHSWLPSDMRALQNAGGWKATTRFWNGKITPAGPNFSNRALVTALIAYWVNTVSKLFT